MKVYLMRHGDAVPLGSPGFSKDPERPLTLEGRKKLQAICEGLKVLDPDWELIFTSPYLRAKETAQIVARHFEMENLIEESFYLTPRHRAEEIITMLGKHPSAKSVLLVGHEPAMSEHLSTFVFGQPRGAIEFKKGGLALVEFSDKPEQGMGSLSWLMTPGQMMRLGKKRKY